MPSVREILENALREERPVVLIYNGGSQPGTARELEPLHIAGDELRARDLATGLPKTYKIERFDLPESGDVPKAYEPNLREKAASPATVEQLVAHRKPELEAMGWHVRLGENEITVYKFFKNGKPQKGAKAGVLYYPQDSPSRPFYVFGPGLASARTFGHVEKAVLLFLSQATEHAPES